MTVQAERQDTSDLGADIRTLRQGRGLSLAALAGAVGRSTGWLSQVERGLASPAVGDLRRIADALGRPLSFFFRHEPAPPDERGLVVRADHAARLGDPASGLVEELLSPHLSGAFEMLRSTFSPGARDDSVGPRATEEGVAVVSGMLDVTVRGRAHRLRPGDAMQLQGGLEAWSCPGPEPCVTIWVVAPPSY